MLISPRAASIASEGGAANAAVTESDASLSVLRSAWLGVTAAMAGGTGEKQGGFSGRSTERVVHSLGAEVACRVATENT